MKNEPFTPYQFVDSKFSTKEEKAKFANHFVRFVNSGFKKSLFYDWFYKRLSMTFGHIAHYNRLGFWETWFESPNDQACFMHHTKTAQIYGDPAFTYCDVELALKNFFKNKQNKIEIISS